MIDGYMNLSVVIPCYNEEKRITTTIKRLEDFFVSESKNKYQLGQVEVLCIENGSRDATSRVIEDLIEHSSLDIKLLHTEKGKGNAVRRGVHDAKFERVLVMDADNATDISHLAHMMDILHTQKGVDIVNSSRRIDGAYVVHRQGVLRRVLGNTFHILVHNIFSLPVSDSQNGFKLFKTEVARHLYSKVTTTGWVSEVELFIIAKKLKYRVSEIPVTWHDISGSTLGLNDVPKIVYDLLKITIYHYFQKHRLHDLS